MKRLALLLMFAPLCVYAQTGVLQGHCFQGGKQATTSGMNSSNYLDGNIPACTVTVYLTGTLTKQTITKPDGSALANPFTANTATAVDPGGWILRAATNQGLDVVMSGGNSNPNCITAPLCYTQPVTLVDVFPTQSFSPVINPLTIQTNGTGNTSQSLLNFTNSPTVTFSNPSGGVETASAQIAGGLLMQVTPPAPGQQQLILYPTSSSGTGFAQNTVACGGSSPGTSCSGSGALANGGSLAHPYCSSGCTSNPTITWTFTAPSYLPATGLTVYGGNVSYSYTTTAVGNMGVSAMTCGIGGSQTNVSVYNVGSAPPPLQTYTAALSGVTTSSQVSTVTCTASINETDPVQAGAYGNFPSVFLVINYTGTAPPANTAITVIPPLNFNPGPNSLSLVVPFDVGIDTGSANAYAVSLPWVTQAPGTTVKFVPTHLSTSTTPTFSFNGITATIVGPQGGALQSNDLNTTATAIVVLDNAGNWRLQDPQVSGSSANTISVNGTVVSSPNLNDTTPAAGTNGKNIAWQHSGSSVSAEIVGNGNASTYLDGTGNYSTPAGGGSVTWPASADVVISNGTNSPAGVAPVNGSCLVGSGGAWTSGSCSGGGSGVQYNPSNTQIVFTGSSWNGDDQRILSTAINVTGWTANGTNLIITFPAPHGLQIGDYFSTEGLTGFPTASSPFGNWTSGVDIFQVISTGFTSTQIEAAYSTTTGSGSGGSILTANYFLPFLVSSKPFYKGHGVVTLRTPVGSTMASLDTNFSTVIGNATTTPAFLAISGGWDDDLAGCASAATIEGHLQSIWAKAHTAGFTVMVDFVAPLQFNTSNLGCTTAFQTWMAVDKWVRGQGKSNANAASGQYWDIPVGAGDAVRDAGNNNLIANIGFGVPTAGGVAVQANVWNEAMATQSSSIKTFPFYWVPMPLTTGSLAGSAYGVGFYPTQNAGNNKGWSFLDASFNEILTIGTNADRIYMPFLAAVSGNNCLHIDTNGLVTNTGADCSSNPLSGMTAGQVPIAATATTVTSSKALAGSGTGITTGPTTSTNNDIATFSGTSGQLQDGGALSGTSPIVVSGLNVSCPTCTTSAGGPATSLNITISNAGTTGTTTNTLTKLTGAPSTAVIAATTDTGGVVGICTSGCSTTGTATIQIAGSASCVFSNATTAGHYVGISSATAGNCVDAGATYPTSGQIIGRVLVTNASPGTNTIDLFPSEIKGGSGSGGLTPAPPYLTDGTHFYVPSDGYQVTKPLASPSFLTATVPTITVGTNGNVIVTGSGSNTYWESQTATTSVEAVMRNLALDVNASNVFPASGIWIWDSTNNKIFVLSTLIASATSNNRTIITQCQVWTYSGSGSPTFSSNLLLPLTGSYGYSDYAHYKLVKSGSTLSFQMSIDGGATYQTLTTQSVGTISKGGYFLGTSTAAFDISVISELVQ